MPDISLDANDLQVAGRPADFFSALTIPPHVIERRKRRPATCAILSEPGEEQETPGAPADSVGSKPAGDEPDAHTEPARPIVERINLKKGAPSTDAPPQEGDCKLLSLKDGSVAPSVLAETVLKAMVEQNDPAPRLFNMGGAPTRMIVDLVGTAKTQLITRDILKHEIGRVAYFRDFKYNNKRIGPPTAVIAHLMGMPNWPFPKLSRIIASPVFTAAGTLVSAPGYDRASSLYLQTTPGFAIASIPSRPTGTDVRWALQQLLEIVWDFPFADEASFHNYLGLLLEPFVREMIRGPTPLHLLKKPVQGTGAGLLADTFSQVAFGQPAATQAESRDEEIRKSLTAFMLSRAPLYFLDNLNHKLDSSALAMALTSSTYQDRVLGGSTMMKAPVSHTWLASGNNPELSDEIGRRTSFIELDAHAEDPTKRGNWRHPDLIAYVRTHRADLVRALLILVRAWIAAGQPPGQRMLASFESWSRVVGGILGNVGADAFLANHDRLKSSTRDGDAGVKVFVELWWARHAGTTLRIGHVDKDTSGQHRAISGSLCEILHDHRDDLDLGFLGKHPSTWWSSLGRTLHRVAGRTFEIADGGGAALKVIVTINRGSAGQEYALARV